MTLKERIKNNERLCGTIVSLTDPCLCEIFGRIGYDYIWVDMEHTYMSYKDVLCHINAAQSVNTPVIVRVSQNDLTETKKILEMGPDGIIFPMVKTAKEAKELIAMTLYPPYGTRGFGPMRAIGYGVDSVEAYVKSKSWNMCRFIQIEDVRCVENLEEIAEIQEIDGFIFGPNDLSASIGEIGRVFDENTTNLIKKAIDILKSANKYIGLAGSCDKKTIEYWSNFGIQMLTAGSDWVFVCRQGQETFKNLKEIQSKNF